MPRGRSPYHQPSPEIGFWPKVNKAGPISEHAPDAQPCWLWTGVKVKGYGTLKLNGRRTKAHRRSYELLVGPIPEGLEIDHLCRVPACVRPSHLEPVTHAENMRRGIFAQSLKTHCPQGHAYSPENTKLYGGRRYCRACGNQRARQRRARERVR